MVARQNRRREVRQTVSWPAVWRDEEGAPQQGIVCDIGSGGAFVRPLVGSSTEHVGRDAAVPMTIFLDESGHSRSQSMRATVRWQGYHDVHETSGIGVQFEKRVDARMLEEARHPFGRSR